VLEKGRATHSATLFLPVASVRFWPLILGIGKEFLGEELHTQYNPRQATGK